jgi:DNA polymerase-3 subunit beta
MKFTIEPKTLKANLNAVSRIVPSRPTHPILSNILIDAKDDGTVTLTGFDLTIGMSATFSADVSRSGKTTVPSRLFGEIISKIPENIVIEVNDSSMAISSANGTYEINCMDASEYPDMPSPFEEAKITMDAASLAVALKRSLFAASNDETKLILTGVSMTLSHESVECASTDGHRLAVVSIPTNSLMNENIPPIVIPGAAVRELAKNLSGNETTITMGQSIATFAWEGKILNTRLMDGQYPLYRQLIPSQFQRTITVNRKDILDAVERVSVLADQKAGIIKMIVNHLDQDITLCSEAQDVGSGKESISADIQGTSCVAAFNSKYLIEGLKELNSSDEISIQMNGTLAPVIIRPLSSIDVTYLIMPVQIRD